MVFFLIDDNEANQRVSSKGLRKGEEIGERERTRHHQNGFWLEYGKERKGKERTRINGFDYYE